MAGKEHERKFVNFGHPSPEAVVLRETSPMNCRGWLVWDQDTNPRVTWLKV